MTTRDTPTAKPIRLHDNPAQSWLIQVILDGPREGKSIHDAALQRTLRETFNDNSLELPVLADELYRQGIVCLRAAQWMHLPNGTRQIITNCMAESRQPIW